MPHCFVDAEPRLREASVVAYQGRCVGKWRALVLLECDPRRFLVLVRGYEAIWSSTRPLIPSADPMDPPARSWNFRLLETGAYDCDCVRQHGIDTGRAERNRGHQADAVLFV